MTARLTDQPTTDTDRLDHREVAIQMGQICHGLFDCCLLLAVVFVPILLRIVYISKLQFCLESNKVWGKNFFFAARFAYCKINLFLRIEKAS